MIKATGSLLYGVRKPLLATLVWRLQCKIKERSIFFDSYICSEMIFFWTFFCCFKAFYIFPGKLCFLAYTVCWRQMNVKCQAAKQILMSNIKHIDDSMNYCQCFIMSCWICTFTPQNLQCKKIPKGIQTAGHSLRIFCFETHAA